MVTKIRLFELQWNLTKRTTQGTEQSGPLSEVVPLVKLNPDERLPKGQGKPGPLIEVVLRRGSTVLLKAHCKKIATFIHIFQRSASKDVRP